MQGPQELKPESIAPPFARYAHGVIVPEGYRLVLTSGQLGLAADGSVLAERGAFFGDAVRIDYKPVDTSIWEPKPRSY